ncbi:MAG TPA: acylneuraminate cytidylyltransferase family protein [Dehalococcoidia bacterium]|nr:acylneuraminate cytidylyltransferase family protein [Dehalococcoidia bacterium]
MKANSERVKGKNFKRICGKPLFSWVLDSLLNLEEIERVIINTDAREVLAENGLVEESRVQIRDRKPELCGDAVSMNLVLADDVENVPADLYLMTHTTNPLLSSATIRNAIDLFIAKQASGADSLFSVNRFQTRFYREDGSPINHDPTNLIPTQNLEPWLEENSCLYLFTEHSLKATGPRIGVRPVMFETPKLESVDIDEPEDWLLAEALLNSTVGSS